MSEAEPPVSRSLLERRRPREVWPATWQPDAAQLAILDRLDIRLPHARADAVVTAHRPFLWRHGTSDDIRRGEYLVEATHVSDTFDLYDMAGFDFDYIHPSDASIGYSRGLTENIALDVGGIPMLVMDKHNFATAWILDLQQRGALPISATMLHIDEHDDQMPTSRRLDVARFLVRRDTRDAVEMLLDGTSIGSWINTPILSQQRVDQSSYTALKLGRADGDNGNHLYLSSHTSPHARFDIDQPSAFDIVDVDIDTLNVLDIQLDPDLRRRIGTGEEEIPTSIDAHIRTMAEVAARAKAITIATSPGFIYQPNAIQYVKRLIHYIEQIRQTSSDTSHSASPPV